MINGRKLYMEKSFWVAVISLAVIAAKEFIAYEIPNTFVDSLINIVGVVLGGGAIAVMGNKNLR